MSVGWLLLDGVLVILALVVVVKYAKKGFLQALIHFIGVMLAFGIAIIASSLIAKAVYNGVIREQLVEAVEGLMRIPSKQQPSISTILHYVPAILLNLLAATYGDGYASVMQDALSKRTDAPAYIADSIVAPAVVPVMSALVFFVLFLVLLLVVKLVSRIFKNVNQLPLIGPVNALLGGVLGLIVAILVLCLITKAVAMLSAINGGDGLLISKDLINKTILFRLLSLYNPIELLFGFLS